jgi:Gram-negative bacterial TonB protein C-terminal
MVAGAPAVYVWEDPGDSIMVQLSLDVVDRLSAAVQQGLGAGGRGVEIGGILLGRPDPSGGRTVLIEDFEQIPCEHARGASYTLSRHDLATLGAHLERRQGRQVAGYFRSHTRPGMYLDQEDYAVISTCFQDPSQVFLLVKPGPDGTSVGGFFFWEEGDINRRASYRQFPFERQRLLQGAFPMAEQPPAPPPAISRAARARRVPPASWLMVPLIAGLLLIAGFFVAQSRSRSGAPAIPALQVRQAGNALELRWDKNSPVIRKAGMGILWITDGAQRVRRELDPKALAEGRITYAPVSRNVNFELQVFALTQRIHQSVRGWEPPPSAPVTQVATNLAVPAQTQTELPKSAQRAVLEPALPQKAAPKIRVAKARGPHTHVSKRSPVLPVRAPVTVARAAPSALAPPPALAPSHVPQPNLAGLLAPHAVSLPPAPLAEVSYEVPHASVFRRVFRKITPFGDSSSEDFVPASPIHKVAPRVPAGVEDEAAVDVKIYIDDSGNVSRAQLLSPRSPLAAPSLSAARQWQFAPARKHDKPVASEIVLHFRFGSEGDI